MPARYAILAVPGRFHGWLVEALGGRLAASGWTAEHRSLPEQEPYDLFSLGPPDRPAVLEILVAHLGSAGLRAEIAAGSLPCVILDEPLAMAAAALQASTGRDLPQAVRAVTRAKAQHADLLRARPDDGMLRYWPTRHHDDALALLETVLAWAGAQLACSGQHGPNTHPEAARHPVHAVEHASAPTSRKALAGTALDDDCRQLDIGAGVFVLGDAPDAAVSGPVTVTGPARILTGGPYVHLPRGPVQCALSFSVTAPLDGERFQVKVYSETAPVASHDFAVQAGLPMQVRFSFDNPCADRPVDLHLLNLAGAIDGELQLHGARFTLAPTAAHSVP